MLLPVLVLVWALGLHLAALTALLVLGWGAILGCLCCENPANFTLQLELFSSPTLVLSGEGRETEVYATLSVCCEPHTWKVDKPALL